MTSSTIQNIQPRIYVACLATYNNGRLHGAWIDVGTDEWAICDGIQAMLKASPIAGAEEYAIHDYEGFQGVRIEEYTGIVTLTAIAAFLLEHGTVGAEVLNYYGGDLDEARAAMEDRHLGSFTSLADYVQEVTEETVTIPQPLRYYIDWQAMARDAEINGDVFTIEVGHDEVHVFAGC
jgi:antirestriction protein